MMVEAVMAVLIPILSFATTYTPSKAHNMLALMLDPHFVCMDVVKVFVGWEKVMEMVVEYDTKFLMSLMVASFHLQNLGFVDPIIALVVVDEDSIFSPVTSNEAILQGLLKNELSLFCQLHVKLEHYLLPLIWWKSNELQFPNISFVAKQILGLGFKLKSKEYLVLLEF
jgi:hypothetical protein